MLLMHTLNDIMTAFASYLRRHSSQSLWRDSTSQDIFSKLWVLAVFEVVDPRPEPVLVRCLGFTKLLEYCLFYLFRQVLNGVNRVFHG